MGKKILISEQDKIHIKKLYEDKKLSPPEESVLVENKNPFKYSQYQTARRYYSANLKDGELFFTFDSRKLDDYIESKVKENFNNKTIRYSVSGIDEDEVGTLFLEYDHSVDMSPPVGVYLKSEYEPIGTQCISSFVMLLKPKNDGIVFNPKVGFDNIIVSGIDEDIAYLKAQNDYYKNKNSGLRTVQPSSKRPKTKQHKITVSGNESIKSKVFSFSNWNTLPDEFFEIRKIQKQKTDF